LLINDVAATLNESGLERAEQVARENGFDLYEAMEEAAAATSEEVTIDIEEPPDEAAHDEVSGGEAVIYIDPLSEAFKELDAQMAIAIRDLRGRNELMELGGAEASQRMAELEAGSRLLKADQADAKLLKRLLLPALNWFAKKVGDETAKQLIAPLIAMVMAYIAAKLVS
jgi:hypothetical protein